MPVFRTISVRVFSAAMVLAGFSPLAAQTIIDPARAAAATPTGATSESILRAQDPATSEALGMEAYAPISPGDDDIGQQLILKRNEKIEPFAVWLDSSGFWTDNAANVNEGNIEDWFYVGGVNLGWQKRLKGRFYGDVYAGQHWYRYDELDELNYESGEVSVGTLVAIPELANSVFHLHYYYQRITQDIDDDPIYQTHNLRVGAQKTFLINRLNSVNLSLLGSFALDTDPEILRRHEYSMLLGYNFKIMRELAFSMSYRLAYYDYFNLEGRHDWYHNFGLALTWRPTENFEVSLGYNFTFNESNYDVFSYETHLAGPSVAAKYKF